MNLRRVAAKVIAKVLKQGQSLNGALDNALESIRSNQDKAFVQALCYGVMRQFHRLDFILQQLVSKPVKDEEIKALLLIGLYQLHYMRVKPHAAVSETVAALSKKKQFAKPLTNAVLRRYLREQQTLETLADANPVAASSHPKWLLKLIGKQWPEQLQNILQQNNQQAPMVLRVNATQTTVEDYQQRLLSQGLDSVNSELCDTAISLKQAVNVEQLPGFADGLVSVQDTAAQLAAGLLDLSPGISVLDVCAAPGGKTAHLLEFQPGLEHVLAVDSDAQRLERVKTGLKRLQLHAELKVGDARFPEQWSDGRTFQRILLDAPCSATGVIRRHPDIKVLRRESDIDKLLVLQQEILEAVWPLLTPGGMLLYATCSVLQQENELQIARFLAEHHDASEIKINATWGAERPVGRQILTGEQVMDGFYYARINKH